jgi:hypothetical protein
MKTQDLHGGLQFLRRGRAPCCGLQAHPRAGSLANVPDQPATLAEIKKTLSEQREHLATHYKVREMGVFGSYARGEQAEGSDVDILVDFSEPVGFFLFLDLEDYLGSLLGRRVELVTRRALKPNIGKAILRDLVTV